MKDMSEQPDRSTQIIRTSWIGIAANVLLAAFKVCVEMLASPVHDDAALIAQLTAKIQPLVPEMQVVVVVDHNYSE